MINVSGKPIVVCDLVLNHYRANSDINLGSVTLVTDKPQLRMNTHHMLM